MYANSASLLLLAVVALLGVALPRSAIAQEVFSSGNRSARDVYGASLRATGFVLGVRRDLSDGLGAPQVGLDPGYPQGLAQWEEFASQNPDAAAPYQPCVDIYGRGIEAIREVAPYMRRPLYDTSAGVINAGLKRARSAIEAGDACREGVAPPVDPRIAEAENRNRVLQGRVEETRDDRGPGDGQPPLVRQVPEFDPRGPIPPDDAFDPGQAPLPSGRVIPAYDPPPGYDGPPRQWGLRTDCVGVPECYTTGYNPCYNPRPPLQCYVAMNPSVQRTPPKRSTPPTRITPQPRATPQTRTTPPPVRNTPPTPPQEPDCHGLPPPDTQRRLMTLAEDLDRLADGAGRSTLAATNSFFAGANRAVAANLAFLAQKPGEPARQMFEGTIRYLTNDNASNHAALYKAAEAEVEKIRRDPAGALGEFAGDQLFGAVTDRVTRVIGCRLDRVVSPGRKKLIEQAEEAGQKLRQMDREAGQAYGQGPICGSAGVIDGRSVNPFGNNVGCVPQAIAADKRRLTGRPWYDSDVYRGEYGTNGLGNETISGLLKEHYAGGPPPRGIPDEWLPFWQEGVGVQADRATIQKVLEDAGEGSGGIVFLRQKVLEDAAPGPGGVVPRGPDGRPLQVEKVVGHAVRAYHGPDGVRFVDDQISRNADPLRNLPAFEADASHYFESSIREYFYMTGGGRR